MNKFHKYYLTYIKKKNFRCKDCDCLISFGKHLRCKKCYNINKAIISYKKTIRKLYKLNHFLLWFTGFWEGEGTVKIYTKKQRKNQEGYKIAVSQKERACLFEIKKIFKFGNVYSLGRKNVCSVWSSDNIGEILALIKYMLPLIKSPRRLKQIKKFLKGKRIKIIMKTINTL